MRRAGLLLAGSISVWGAVACTLNVTPPATPTARAEPAMIVTANDVVVGAVLSLSGRFSREGALMKAGYQTWLAAVQQAGGLRVGSDRRPVRLVFADDESEPLTAGQRVETLTSDAGARLLLGPFSSQLTGAVVAAADKEGALVVAPDGSAPSVFRRGFKLMVSVKPSDADVLHGLADLAATVRPRAQPIGVLLADEESLTAEVDGFHERALALGLDPVQVVPVLPGSTDLAAVFERIGQLAPRLLVIAAAPGQIDRLVSRIHVELAPVPMLALTRLPDSTDLSQSSVRYDGALSVQIWSPSRLSRGPGLGSAGEFAGQFERLHGYAPGVNAAAAAAAGLALQLGIEQAGSIGPVEVRRALGSLDQETFWGRLAWDVDGRLRDAVVPVLQQRGSDRVIVYPPNLATSRVRYPITD